MLSTFPAYLAEEHGGRVEGRITHLTTDQLPAGQVTFAVEYSSINFKDALAATGQNKVAGSYPHVPGIDAAGTVDASDDGAWKPGDRVLVTGYDFGAGRWGGWARYARVPAEWVVRIPDALSTRDAMALGTAGYTAALCLLALQRNGTMPAEGPVVVTGATGGVGCLSVDLLAAQGYRVVASTGKPERHDWLRALGAAEIVDRAAVQVPAEVEPRPLMPARFAGAIDNVGGAALDYLVRSVKIGGNVALCGLVGGTTFRGTVLPFILRGVGLLGIDSGHTPIAERQAIWERLAADLRPRHLDAITRVIGLEDVTAHVASILRGQEHGRLVVKLDS
jgi:putative YhdH/YhfP family quinone oxidoreductase